MSLESRDIIKKVLAQLNQRTMPSVSRVCKLWFDVVCEILMTHIGRDGLLHILEGFKLQLHILKKHKQRYNDDNTIVLYDKYNQAIIASKIH